jgi:hypothetical protein
MKPETWKIEVVEVVKIKPARGYDRPVVDGWGVGKSDGLVSRSVAVISLFRDLSDFEFGS